MTFFVALEKYDTSLIKIGVIVNVSLRSAESVTAHLGQFEYWIGEPH